MKLLVLALLAAAYAAPQGYNLPSSSAGSCGQGQVLHQGQCVTAQVNSRVFLFEGPPNVVPPAAPTYLPKPKIERNVVLVRLPEAAQGPQPIVIPPPRQEHVVYVLNKQSEQNQQVIEVPGQPPSNPEVFFVNYADGENPTLPNGVDLQTALNAATQGGGNNGGGFGGSTGGRFGGGSGGGFGGGAGGGGYSPPSNVYSTP